MSVTIYHNPRCSKSRQTLDLVRSKTDDIEIVEYLKTPPAHEELANIVELLAIAPRDLCRKKEAEYKAAGIDNSALSDQEVMDLMIQNPKVIERPIVVFNGKAVIGRPPENVLDIL